MKKRYEQKGKLNLSSSQRETCEKSKAGRKEEEKEKMMKANAVFCLEVGEADRQQRPLSILSVFSGTKLLA